MTLDELLGRPYRVEAVRREDGSWVARLPDLHIVAEAADRAQALDRLDAAQRALFQAHLDAGTAATLPAPRPDRAEASSRLWPKAAATAFVLVAVVLALESVAARALERLPERGLRYVYGALQSSTTRARQVSEDRQRELARGLKGFVAAVAPFLDEVSTALPDRRCPDQSGIGRPAARQ